MSNIKESLVYNFFETFLFITTFCHTSFTSDGTQMYFDLCFGGWSLCLRLVLVRAVSDGFSEATAESESGHCR